MCKKLLLLSALAFVCAPVFAAVEDVVSSSESMPMATMSKARGTGKTMGSRGMRTRGARGEDRGQGYKYGHKKSGKGSKGYGYGRNKSGKMATLRPAMATTTSAD